MTKTICIFLCLLFPYICYSQDSLVNSQKKNQFYLQGGFSYKTFLGSSYIEPTPYDPYNLNDNFLNHQYERFTKESTDGFSLGVLFSHAINGQWNLVTGLLYFLRKDVFENNQDTVIMYGNGSSIRDIHNVLKYDYSYNNIEIPVLIQYKRNKLNFYAGANFSLLTYKSANYAYIINQYPQFPQWTTSDKTIAGFADPFMIFPTLQFSYDSRIRNMKINPFIGFYYGINEQESFCIQVGIIVPLTNKRSKKSNT